MAGVTCSATVDRVLLGCTQWPFLSSSREVLGMMEDVGYPLGKRREVTTGAPAEAVVVR